MEDMNYLLMREQEELLRAKLIRRPRSDMLLASAAILTRTARSAPTDPLRSTPSPSTWKAVRHEQGHQRLGHRGCYQGSM